MHSVTMIGLAAIFTAYFLFIAIYLRKKRNIKMLPGSIFLKDRNVYGIVLELAIFMGFMFALFAVYMKGDGTGISLISRISPFAALFFLQTLFRGIGEWHSHREEERYWYEWSASLTIFIAFTLLLMMEG
ncbi:DUF4181 domain-containing protein [Planococcus sp. CPCC 101016]|uniref:DUF4181 domain-containing protein n=1 Tax=Planococcus sp. CPCC 101016 TaxID=2599617 RepID=UPI0011B59E76|nr:DUF4181 domain-containing protein [Planococcus sp. CPCC 101016]TWT06547.1 DUF4181 domain-containing protein [Planococcus sp. CPCC 101016]